MSPADWAGSAISSTFALQERGQRLERVGDHLFELRDSSSTPLARFTDDRDKATSVEGLELLGLDHSESSKKRSAEARAIAPEDLGASVKTGDGLVGVAVGGSSKRPRRRANVAVLSCPW